jgi:ketosteroid isomerase-like protein
MIGRVASDNVELVQAIYASWAKGDFGSVDWAHLEIEFVFADGPTPGSWTGIAAMGSAWGEIINAWDEFSAAAEGFRELDGDRVLVLTKNTGRGKISGLDLSGMETRGANVFHLRDGKVTRLVLYFERERALADVGLAA